MSDLTANKRTYSAVEWKSECSMKNFELILQQATAFIAVKSRTRSLLPLIFKLIALHWYFDDIWKHNNSSSSDKSSK